MTYGMPTGTNIVYGSTGFPAWVYTLGAAFDLKASTYPGHQESDRAESGFAPNPQRLNRGIDWTGAVADMQRFADYLLTVKGSLEQVIFENPVTGRRVGVAGGDDVSSTPYYSGDYSGHRDHVHTRQSQPIPLPDGAVAARPDFNEYAVWSPSNSGRGGVKPSMFLLHTQEGNGNADSLARWLANPANQVSYHYTVSQDVKDNGVTVCDGVDTDLASWSVLDYNSRSINLCFAGSRAAWSRAEWMRQSRAIDVAAYLAVQDCRKYGIATRVVPPPYSATPGVSDHAYVTSRGIGTHTDVGPNFPWDYFGERFEFWLTGKTPAPAPSPEPAPVPAPSPAPAPVVTADRTELEWLAFIGDQAALTQVGKLAKSGDQRAIAVLVTIEAVNPAALQQFLATAKG